VSVSPAAVGAKEGKAGVWPRRLLDIVGYLALALCLALLGSLLTVAATNLLGYENFVIYSGSMEPTVKVGSLLLTRPVDVEDLRVGDVITYRSPGNHTTLTHRIVSIRQEDGDWVFQTKGDANPEPDPREVVLRGQVTKMAFDIPYLGLCGRFRQEHCRHCLVLAGAGCRLGAHTGGQNVEGARDQGGAMRHAHSPPL